MSVLQSRRPALDRVPRMSTPLPCPLPPHRSCDFGSGIAVSTAFRGVIRTLIGLAVRFDHVRTPNIERLPVFPEVLILGVCYLRRLLSACPFWASNRKQLVRAERTARGGLAA